MSIRRSIRGRCGGIEWIRPGGRAETFVWLAASYILGADAGLQEKVEPSRPEARGSHAGRVKGTKRMERAVEKAAGESAPLGLTEGRVGQMRRPGESRI